MNLKEKDRQAIDVQLATASDVVRAETPRNLTAARGVAGHKLSFVTLFTNYAAWNDLILWRKEPTEEAIFYKILNRWNEIRRCFSKECWKAAIGWMKEHGYAPTGFGKLTKAPE